jgi:hypothetical protein
MGAEQPGRPPEPYHGLFYLCAVFSFHNQKGELRFPLSQAVLSTTARSPERWYLLEEPEDEERAVADLLVSRDERDRFEERYKKAATQDSATPSDGEEASSTPSANAPLSTKEKANLLKLIGLLTRLYVADKGPQFLNKGEPNVNQVVLATLDYLEKETGTIQHSGLSKTNLWDKINAGLKELSEALADYNK